MLLSSVCWFQVQFFILRGLSLPWKHVCLQHWSFCNRCCTLTTKYTLPSLSLCTQSNFVWVLLSSYSVYGLVIYVNNPPWWLCLFHVADRYKIPIKMYFWLDLNKFVTWCSKKKKKKGLKYSFSKPLYCKYTCSASHIFYPLILNSCISQTYQLWIISKLSKLFKQCPLWHRSGTAKNKLIASGVFF